jgi:diaminohydroxyphosphoribosylaminopyrimidine deaminase/5-amino-6-(5-phosphoribosylamino)uracil reductase
MNQNENLFIERCFQLAEKGRGHVEPNPMVGAVLVYKDRIIGEGYHRKFGGPHAEVNCIESIKDNDRSIIAESTLYVSLEPCHHHGKTPPCTDLIIENNIKKVVIGSLDFNAQIHGHGIETLKQKGIEVKNFDLYEKQKKLNLNFFVNKKYKKPLTIAKWAQSADSFIGEKGKRTTITSLEVDALMHKLRSHSKAILVGKNTFRTDRPMLTTRLIHGKNPIRVTIDSTLENLELYQSYGELIVFNEIESKNMPPLSFHKIEDAKDTTLVLSKLYDLNLDSVLVEGGTELLQSFLDQDTVDVIYRITNEMLILKNGISSPIPNFNSFICEETFNIGGQKVEKFIHKRIWGETE